MNTRRAIVPILSLLAIAALLALGIGGEAPITEANARLSFATPIPFADPLFRQQWEYSDKPVQDALVSRPWIWGAPGEITLVDYKGAPTSPAKGIPQDKLLVQYFDKARMEYNNLDSKNPPIVTNGRLVVEMITGRVETGEGTYLDVLPAMALIAGDGHKETPTYATLYSVASQGVGGNETTTSMAKMYPGTKITRSFNRFGNVDQVPGIVVSGTLLSEKAKAKEYITYDCTDTNNKKMTCAQNIPDVFWTFLNSGIFDWKTAVGLPITEPYWIKTKIGSQEQWVLFQAFERRVLTYNPANLPPWDVEMGNVGQHYRAWRDITPDPNGALVIQAKIDPDTKVCFSYPSTNYASCVAGQGPSEPAPSTDMLRGGSWASTGKKGGMILQSASTIFNLKQLAKLSFKTISDDVTEGTQNDGQIDYVHDPTKGKIVVESGQWRVVSEHSLFSVIVTSTASAGQSSFFVMVPSLGSDAKVQEISGTPGREITVKAGRQLTIAGATPGTPEPISKEGEAYWAALLIELKTIPSLRGVLQNSTGISNDSRFADPLFQQQWEYSDKPVQDGLVSRPWIWGAPGEITLVDYAGAPAYPAKGIPQDKLLVQYFDKALMKYDLGGNLPAVTNGRLVVEMITGQVEIGQGKYLNVLPATKPIAGDTLNANKNTPTYATLYSVTSPWVGGAAPSSVPMALGSTITRSLDRSGNVGQAPTSVWDKARVAVYQTNPCIEPIKGPMNCGQNIPDVFWNFLNQSGLVYKDGRYQQGKVLYNGLASVEGSPITEPYWIQINISGKEQWVLFQAYERRILTYNPTNPPQWAVEMGNVGLHYKEWRNK